MAQATELKMNTSGRQVKIDSNVVAKAANYTWFRGSGVNYLPDVPTLTTLDAAFKEIVKGHAPPAPFITPQTSITAFGSCFAANIANWLHDRKYNVETKKEGEAYIIRCGEGMVNTFTILGQFKWAFEGYKPEGNYWHGYNAEEFGYDENVRQATREIFDKTDVFILTFGLSEIWYDKPTGEVFWRAVPHDKFDPERHAFRVSSVEENKRNILEIFALIKKYRPDAKVIVTLSPVPLIATFRNMSCISANSVSKATLRVAIDEAVRETQTEVYYWPSYEFVLEYFNRPWSPDRRHVKRPLLDFIMTAFERVYSTNPPSDRDLNERILLARVADGTLPQKVRRGLTQNDRAALEEVAAKLDDTQGSGLKSTLEAVLRDRATA
jgi:hypothetical protein